MKQSKFRELCDAISLKLVAENPNYVGDSGKFDIEGVRIGLFFDENALPDRMVCYVGLGPIEERCKVDAMQHLLTLNLLSGAKTNGVYAIDPSSGDALFVVHFEYPDELEVDEIAQALVQYANLAATLRNTLSCSAGGPATWPKIGSAESHPFELA